MGESRTAAVDEIQPIDINLTLLLIMKVLLLTNSEKERSFSENKNYQYGEVLSTSAGLFSINRIPTLL